VYPIWNVADAAIFIGVGVFILLYLLELKAKVGTSQAA
jgi:lipoprotein signal peptidase